MDVSKVFLESFKGVSIKIEGWFEGVLKRLQGYFKNVQRACQGRLKELFMVKGISKVFQGIFNTSLAAPGHLLTACNAAPPSTPNRPLNP